MIDPPRDSDEPLPDSLTNEAARGDAPPIDALLDDLAGAEHDILSLARRHGLSLDGLVDWAFQPNTRRIVAGLCVLADAQTQLLLSRYRLLAATRLISQATADSDTLAPEQIRKACVDLLKTELSRAAGLDQADDISEQNELEALARAMSDPSPATPLDQDHDASATQPQPESEHRHS